MPGRQRGAVLEHCPFKLAGHPRGHIHGNTQSDVGQREAVQRKVLTPVEPAIHEVQKVFGAFAAALHQFGDLRVVHRPPAAHGP